MTRKTYSLTRWLRVGEVLPTNLPGSVVASILRYDFRRNQVLICFTSDRPIVFDKESRSLVSAPAELL